MKGDTQDGDILFSLERRLRPMKNIMKHGRGSSTETETEHLVCETRPAAAAAAKR